MLPASPAARRKRPAERHTDETVREGSRRKADRMAFSGRAGAASYASSTAGKPHAANSSGSTNVVSSTMRPSASSDSMVRRRGGSDRRVRGHMPVPRALRSSAPAPSCSGPGAARLPRCRAIASCRPPHPSCGSTRRDRTLSRSRQVLVTIRYIHARKLARGSNEAPPRSAPVRPKVASARHDLDQ